MNHILLVDDEQNVLNALRRELQREYEVEAFTSPTDALETSRDTAFDLVISDYLMPEMSGVLFLKQFGDIQPGAVRLILSGHADIQALIGAINETHIHRIVAKPWEDTDLKSAITQALNYRRILKEKHRLAEVYRESSLASEPGCPERRHTYRIAVVHGDEAASSVIQHGFTLGSEYDAERDALWSAISHESPGAPAKIGFKVDTFASGMKALDRVRLSDYDLVMAAETLPDMSGIEFLGKWRQAQPEAARILIGRPSDVALLSQAINEVQIYCLLDLDWEAHEMMADFRRRLWQVNRMQSSVMEALAAREIVLENERLATKICKYGW